MLTAEVSALGGKTQYGYTFSEQIAAVVDPLGTRSDYKYDLKDRLVEVARGGKIRERYVYDDADNLIEKQDASGATLLSIEVGPGNLVAERKLPSGDRHRLERDRRGRLIKAECNAGKLSFAYDAWGRRIQDERDDKGVQHRFVGANLIETSVLERFVTRYVYPDATTTIVIDPTGQTQRLRALGPGVAQRSFANGIDEVTQYDLDGKCLAKVSTGHIGRAHTWSKRFEFSGEGDLLARHDSEQGVTRHTHDAAHRLASTVHPDGQVDAYKLDLAGNVLEAPGLVAAVTTANTLHSANGCAFEYNARDHVARRHAPEGVVEYRYDSRDQLKAIDAPASAYRAQHDVLGRRTEKDVNGHKTVFYWDTDRLAAELLPDGKLRVYVYPNESALVPLMFVDYASPDAAPESGKRFYVHSDHLGCPERIFDDDARTVWSARIDPYGTAHVEVGTEFHQPLRWPGHYYDAETGLHENRFRTYSPELCRYLQSDPLGVAGGVNLYAYTDNPTRAVDLNGLAKSPNCMDGEEQGGKKRKSEEGPDQEGTDSRKSRATPEQHTLAAAPNAGLDGKPTAAQVAARKRVAAEYIQEHGRRFDRKRDETVPLGREGRKDQANGIDYNHPVVVGPPPPIPVQLYQWQAPGGSRGSYFAHPEATPSQLGIGEYGRAWKEPGAPVAPKESHPYTINNGQTPYMKSTTAPIDDTWSVPEVPGSPPMVQPASGGGTQYTVYDGCDPNYTGITP